MSFHREKHVIAVTAGSGYGQSTHPLRGHLWQIIIEPATLTTNWTLQLNDGNNEEIGGWDDITGAMNSAYGLELPMNGTLRFLFSDVNDGEAVSSPVDETFTIRIVVKEEPYR